MPAERDAGVAAAPAPPAGGYPAGTVLDPVDILETEVEERFRRLLRPASDRIDVVWQDADAEVVFHSAETRVRIVQGVVLVGLQLGTVELGKSMVTVPFAIGLKNGLTGMVITAERKPRGQPLLIDRWGDAAIAVAYGALLQVAADVASAQGRDQDGAPLVAGAVYAQPNRLGVIPQARHPTDRVVDAR
jgi:hypothetical protein